jgi:D-aminoacyl-tRNA deacylase
MRAVVQRVTRASVTVDGTVVGRIGTGLLVLVGVSPEDEEKDAVALAEKLVALRIFPDAEGKMNRSVVEAVGAVLVVSQFTLYADVRKGRRPSFVGAAAPEAAAPLIQVIADTIANRDVEVATGRFGAAMSVDLVNDGPVTLVLEAKDGRIV